MEGSLFCDLAGARTQDPHIKSVMLYLLSYQVNLACPFGVKNGCKSTAFFVTNVTLAQKNLFSPKHPCLDG